MAKFDKKEFGNNIRRARKNKGLSQENLADILGVSRTAITRYENGDVFPSPEQISIICDELDIYANDLFDSSNNKIVNKEKSDNQTINLCIKGVAFGKINTSIIQKYIQIE